MQALVLALVAVAITALVYGGVALIVKADDLGLWLARGRVAAVRALGRGIVAVMPGFLKALTLVGTAAMLWVGGSIISHGVQDLGWLALHDAIHHLAETAARALPQAAGTAQWLAGAGLNGVLGLGLGLALIPLATRVINPVIRLAGGRMH
jgi:predicted DNA repair protein MutK